MFHALRIKNGSGGVEAAAHTITRPVSDPMGSLFGFMMPPSGSTFSDGVDTAFYFVFWVSVFFFFLIVGVMGYFVYKYRRRGAEAPVGAPHHNRTLEIVWSAIPMVLVLFMFGWGFVEFMYMRTPPDDNESYVIQVNAEQFGWTFEYPQLPGIPYPELHVPANKPVKLVMTSKDVIHSFFVPAFRVKRDIVPGRINYTWFEATQETTEEEPYRLYCTEYCGEGHSLMSKDVHVHSGGAFDSWIEQVREKEVEGNPIKYGELIYKGRCSGCHSVDGTRKVGPSFKGVWGEEHEMSDGTVVKVDEQYVLESIWYPQKKIVQGYQNKMPSFRTQLNMKQIKAIIAYLKSLSDQE